MKKLQEHEWLLLLSSLRYFCGRMSIESAHYPATIIEHYYPRLNDTQKLSLAKEIDEVLERTGSIGNTTIDQPIWQKFAAALRVTEHITVELIDGSEVRAFRANGRLYPLNQYLTNPVLDAYIPPESIMEQ